MSDKMMTLTDENWDQEVVAAAQPVLIDFWAEWCIPCRSLAPIMEAIAETYAGRLRVGKLNVEDNPIVPVRYNVTNLPTILLIRRGMVEEQRSGLVNKETLIKLVEQHLG